MAQELVIPASIPIISSKNNSLSILFIDNILFK